MRPDLVLDEDDKKRRFKKYKMSKEESQTASVDDEGNDSGSMHEGFFDDLKNSILEGVKRKKRSVSSDESNETKFQKTKVCEERLGEEDEESDTEDFFDFVKETLEANDVDKIYSDLAQNESFIDPETGLVAGKTTLSQYKLNYCNSSPNWSLQIIWSKDLKLKESRTFFFAYTN